MDAGPVSNCNYAIYMTVLIMLYSLAVGAIHFVRIMKFKRGDKDE